MSRQFQILLTDIDLQNLQEILESMNVEILVDNPSAKGSDFRKIDTLPLPIADAGKISLFCYLVPKHLPRKIVVRRVSDVKQSVDIGRSNLIDFWRPFYDGSNMRPGRMFYQDKYYASGGWLHKDNEFCQWAADVFRRTKKSLSYSKSEMAYVGTHTSDLLSSGDLSLLHI